jgi:hypothetical protein
MDSDSNSVLSRENRGEKIKKYLEKKRQRKNNKFVRYECRKNLAEKRFRYQGRFVKFEQLEELDPEHIYNPNKSEPKTKQIFKVIKNSRKDSDQGSTTGDANFLSEIGKMSDASGLF